MAHLCGLASSHGKGMQKAVARLISVFTATMERVSAMGETYTAHDYFNDPSHPGFLEWGLKIDKLCENTFGLGILDLPDRDYSAAFADGLRPTQVLAEIIDEFGLN